jgi:hypothetical protein
MEWLYGLLNLKSMYNFFQKMDYELMSSGGSFNIFKDGWYSIRTKFLIKVNETYKIQPWGEKRH